MEGPQLTGLDDDAFDGAVEIREDVDRGDAENPKPGAPESNIFQGISLRLIAAIVHLTVDLDCQSRFEASEIGDISPHRVLPAEFPTTGAEAKRAPEQHFRKGHILPKRTGAFYGLDRRMEDRRAPSTSLRLVPLPVPGRISETAHSHPLVRLDQLMLLIFQTPASRTRPK